MGAALEELVSERPSFTQSTEIAPRGWFQWESGVSLDRTGPQRSVALGAPLLRVGVHRRFEVRLGADGYRMERQLRGRASGGLSDINVGFKYKVLQEQRWRPAFAIIPFLSLPTGHSRFTSGTRDPTVKLAWAKDAPLGMSVSGNVNMASLRDKAGRYTRRAYSVAVGREVVAGLAAYGEVYHFSSQGRDTGPVSVFQTGFTYAVGSRTQLDMSVARRLTRQGPDFVVMFGWVTRQPFMLVVNKLR